ncbi:MAG: amidohydrolase family protein [Bacteroidota bacterium]
MKHLFLLFIICLFAGKSDYCFSQELSIKPARTLSFATNEGTEMSVDISPDGKTILFTILGDIYTVPVSGGTATQLTQGMAFNWCPFWSPDGKKIAYLSDFSGDTRLTVRDTKGSFHRVIGNNDPAQLLRRGIWTPDGNSIMYAGNIYGLGGGKIPADSKMGKLLRYSSDSTFAYFLDSGYIYRYDYGLHIKTMVAPLPSRRGIIPTYSANATLSPDGRWWVYSKDTLNIKSCLIIKDLVNVTVRVCKETSYAVFDFSFSADSKSLFIGYGGKIHRIDLGTGTDNIIPFEAHVKTDLGAYNYHTFRVSGDSFYVKYTRSANKSQDGKHLVFSALNKLYMMDLPNGKPHLLVNQPFGQFQPVFSPDGRWVAYVSWSDTVGGHLWRVPSAGGSPEQLDISAGHYECPAWSPDGQSIAAVKSPPNLIGVTSLSFYGNLFAQLQVIPVNGGPSRIIADSIRYNNSLAFSPDGSQVMYMPKAKGNHSIPYLMSKVIIGNHVNTLAIAASQPKGSDIEQVSISPDGRYIVFGCHEDLYMVPVFNPGGTTTIFDPHQKLPVIRFSIGGIDPHWEDGGKSLSWSFGNKFYSVHTDKIFTQAANDIKKAGDSILWDDNTITSLVTPDKTIAMDVAVAGNYAQGTIVLRNARIITMQKDQVIENGTIVISKGHFTAVGPVDKIQIPSGSQIFDLAGKTIMPGIVDMHDHLGIKGGIRVFPGQSWSHLVSLAYGITTSRDPSSDYASFGFGELLKTGQMLGPRLFSAGQTVNPDTYPLHSLEEARAIVHKRALMGGIFIKQYGQDTRLQRQWLLQASSEAGLNMTNEGWAGLFGMYKDGSTGVEHHRFRGKLYKDVTTFLAFSGTYTTPTLVETADPFEGAGHYFHYLYRKNPDTKLAYFTPDNVVKKILNEKSPPDSLHPEFVFSSETEASIRKAGGKVTLGSHGNDQGIGAHFELWALQMGGLTNMEALQAATIMGAEGLGIQKDLGSIQIGKIADLMILNSNPLDDIHNSKDIKYVMKDGVLYNGDTLDEVWPVAKKLPEWKLSNTLSTKK